MAITTWKLNRDEQLNWLLELNTKEYKIYSNFLSNCPLKRVNYVFSPSNMAILPSIALILPLIR